MRRLPGASVYLSKHKTAVPQGQQMASFVASEDFYSCSVQHTLRGGFQRGACVMKNHGFRPSTCEVLCATDPGPLPQHGGLSDGIVARGSSRRHRAGRGAGSRCVRGCACLPCVCTASRVSRASVWDGKGAGERALAAAVSTLRLPESWACLSVSAGLCFPPSVCRTACFAWLAGYVENCGLSACQTDRIHLVLSGMQNGTLGPYLAAINRTSFQCLTSSI
jgi:hypothetical protein